MVVNTQPPPYTPPSHNSSHTGTVGFVLDGSHTPRVAQLYGTCTYKISYRHNQTFPVTGSRTGTLSRCNSTHTHSHNSTHIFSQLHTCPTPDSTHTVTYPVIVTKAHKHGVTKDIIRQLYSHNHAKKSTGGSAW